MRDYKHIKEIALNWALQTKPLQNFFLCSVLKEMYGKKGLIKSMSLKNQILRVQATSNITYTELKHKDTINSLKSLVKQFKKLKNLDEEWDVKKISIFYKPSVSFLPSKKLKTEAKSFFFEPALGDFENVLSDAKLRLEFEKIRKIIIKNRSCS